jgi:glycosyltransferase involved in cell wall biosynthesis
MPRVIFCNRFYWPDEPATSQLLADLAEALAASGWTVVTVTSRKAGSPRREVRHGVQIVRVHRRSDRRHAVGKLFDFAGFMLAACWKLARLAQKRDTVVLMTDPPLLGAIAGLGLRMRGIRCIHWVQDIYPEIAIELTGHGWLRGLRPLRDFAWKKSHACIALSGDMARTMQRAGVPEPRINLIPNWAPVGLKPAEPDAVDRMRKAWGLSNEFVALYSGNLGQVHDLTPLIEAATKLRHEPNLLFVFIGHGHQRPALEAMVRERNLPNVRFLPPQPRELLAAALGVGAIHFVTLLPGCEPLVFPSKLYGMAAIGRLIIAVAPVTSALARQIKTAQMGMVFDRRDTEGLAAMIKTLRNDAGQCTELADHALVFAREHSFAQALSAWRGVLGPEGSLAANGEAHQS